MTTDAIQQLLALEDVRRLRRELLRKFDPFRTLGIEHYELRHTTSLAWLLDTDASHKLDARFLRAFLQRLEIAEAARAPDSPPAPRLLPDSGIKVLREVPVHQTRKGSNRWVFGGDGDAGSDAEADADSGADGGVGADEPVPASDHGPDKPGRSDKHGPKRLDLLLEAPGWAIAIEAKVKAKESKDQLFRYRDAMATRYRDRPFACFFLTIEGDPASTPETWTAISWVRDVHGPLSALMPHIPRETPAEKEALTFIGHYLDLIARIADPDKSEFATAIRALARQKEVAELLPRAEQEFTDLVNAGIFVAAVEHDRWFLSELFRHIQSWRAAMVDRMLSQLQDAEGSVFWTNRDPSKRGTIHFLPNDWQREDVQRNGLEVLAYRIEVKDEPGKGRRKKNAEATAAPASPIGAPRQVEVKLWMPRPDGKAPDPNHALKSTIWRLAQQSPCRLLEADISKRTETFRKSGKLFTISFRYDSDFRLDDRWKTFVEHFRHIAGAQRRLLWREGRMLGEAGHRELTCGCAGDEKLCAVVAGLKDMGGRKPRRPRSAPAGAAI